MATAYETHQRIWQTVSAIPYGRVATYGQIATLAGFPRQARLVGYALYKLPSNTAIPWHRVINAKGMISFPLNSELYLTQRRLLEAEGVIFTGKQIDLKRFGWRLSLDEALWGPRR